MPVAIDDIFVIDSSIGIRAQLRFTPGETGDQHFAVTAMEFLFEDPLDTRASYQITHLVAIRSSIQFALIDFPEISQDLSAGLAVDIAPNRPHHRDHPRQRIGVFFDTGGNSHGNILLD